MTQTQKPASLGPIVRTALQTLIFFPAVILLLAGTWRWVEGWLFSLWIVAMILINTVYMYFKDPALLEERRKVAGGDNQKGWDRYILGAIGVLAIAWLIFMPLDARRFGWSPAFPLWLKIIGGLLLLPALYLIVTPTMQNTFLATRVRIQSERKQQVITSGVYSYVRHPLYLGCVLMVLGAPLLLGSLVGLGIGLIGTVILIFRILGEEKMLVDELEGYREYQQKVRYRLIPYIW